MDATNTQAHHEWAITITVWAYDGPNPTLFMVLIVYLLFMGYISMNRPMRDRPKIGEHETNKDFVSIYRGHLSPHKGTTYKP